MRKLIRISFVVASVFLLLLATSGADVVVLKSGEKIEGKIVSDNETGVTVETVAGGIVDERTIPRADIQKVEKATPDAVAWQQLKQIQVGRNSYPAAQYDRLIAPLRSFVTQFPQSTHTPEAQKTLTALEEEKKRVDDGELKLDGKWITKEEAQKDRYQIGGQLALNRMRDFQTRGDVIGALNAFDHLEQQYPGARTYPDAVALALQILPTVKRQADVRVAALPGETEAQQKAIEAALEPSKSEMSAAVERENAMHEAMLATAERQNLKWPPFLPKSETAMRKIADTAGEELSRLSAIEIPKLRQSIAQAEKAREAVAAKDLPAAEEALNQARELWEANELVKTVSAELDQAKNMSSDEPAAETPPAEVSIDTATTPAATDAPAETETTTATTETETTTAAADEPEVEEESSGTLFKIVLLVILVGIGIAGWKAYKKVKSQASDVLE